MLKEVTKFLNSISKGIKQFSGYDGSHFHVDNACEEETKSSTINETNGKLKISQGKSLILILIAVICCLVIILKLIQAKKQEKQVLQEDPTLKVEVAGDGISAERKWTSHLEDSIRKIELKMDEQLKTMQTEMVEKEKRLKEEYENEAVKLKEQLEAARVELNSASIEFGRFANNSNNTESLAQVLVHTEAGMSSLNFDTDVEYDKPQSSRDYVPVTAFVSGYLLNGLAVSTSISTPDRNAPPVVIRLSGRGNLSKNFKVDIKTCRILGSAYGDLSSERAIIRLEEMTCEDPETGLITTTKVAGVVQGPDSETGIKGKVVATSDKHIKNALIGGIISGVANSAKGRESMAITSLGAVNTKSKGFGDVASEGLLNGTSTAAEKVADYYLRLAESMSPVLIIPGGVKVDAVFTKGFHFGELGTHKKIKNLRAESAIRNETKEVRKDDVY